MTAAIVDRSQFLAGGALGVLLIHGLGGTPVEMRFLARALADAGHTVYCLQLAGHCGSTSQLTHSTLDDWLLSVDAGLARLLQQCDRIVVGGLSMGAILALNLAQRRDDDVDGLLLLAPAFRLDGWAMPWSTRLLAFVRPWMLLRDFDLKERPPYGLKDDRIRAFVSGAMHSGASSEAGSFATPVRALAHFNQLAAVTRAHLGAVTQPALIVHPRDDDMADLGASLMLQRELGGLVESVILDDSYHLVTLDRQRHVVADRACAFVSRIASAKERARRPAISTAGRQRKREFIPCLAAPPAMAGA